MDLKEFEVWFVAGSQHLYGEATLKKVAQHSQEMAQWMTQSAKLPVKVIFKPVVTTADAITELCQDANNARNCIGLITWMHTFSPAKMWIAGLSALRKPFVHLHPQYNRDLPWSEIDMDFMNLNQSAHGDREYGFIGSRMRLNRKVVVGFWQDDDVLSGLSTWMRAAAAWHDAQGGARHASAITRAKWPSPKETRLRPSSGLAIRSTASASATWSSSSVPSRMPKSTGWFLFD